MIKVKTTILPLAIGVLTIVSSAVLADDGSISNDELLREVRALRKQINRQEKRINELESQLAVQKAKMEKQDKTMTKTEEKLEHIDTHVLHKAGALEAVTDGLRIGAGATFVTQMAIDPNSNTTDNQVVDATHSIDLEIEKEFGSWGKAFIHLEEGMGNGLDADEITTFSAVNRDAGPSAADVQVTEVWYEHYFLDQRLAVTAGELDPTVYFDSNVMANDETTQFLNASFRNSSAIEWPTGNSYGFRVGFQPFDWFEVSAGIFEDDADWEDIFEDLFMMAQINVMPNLLNKEGHYRGYIWYDDSPHLKWLPQGTTHQNWGMGASFDQKVLDDMTLFTRFGFEDEDVSVIEWAWSAGLQLHGARWGRDNDYFAVAVGMDIPGGDYDNSGNPGFSEGHLEAYYNFHINDHLSISPDYQLIWNPNGTHNDPINILGVRGQVDL